MSTPPSSLREATLALASLRRGACLLLCVIERRRPQVVPIEKHFGLRLQGALRLYPLHERRLAGPQGGRQVPERGRMRSAREAAIPSRRTAAAR